MTPVPKRPFRVTSLTAAVVASVALMALPVRADVDPPMVDVVLPPGGEFHVDKTVDVPDFPPKLDVCLTIDNSGSYGNDLPNIKALAPGIFDAVKSGVTGGDVRFGLATFVDFPLSPWGSLATADYAYRLEQTMTPTKATWVAAVNAMTIKFGGDGPESQYEAAFQATTGAGNDIFPAGPSVGDIAPGQQCGFVAGRSAVIILSTDAPFHNAGDGGPFPYPGPSAAATAAALNAALGGQGVVFIGLKAPGSGGQMDALAAATGGVVVSTTSTSSDIATAILTALSAIVVTVEHEVDEKPGSGTPAGSCEVVTLDPDFIDVDPPEAGTTVEFEEWIDIPADIMDTDLTADGKIHCNVDFTGNGAPLGTEMVWITVKFQPSMDIKFCSNPNGFNSKRTTGVTPTTLFGGEGGLDVNDIDVSSLQLCVVGGACTGAPVDWQIEDRGDPATDIGTSQCAIDPTTGEEERFLNPDGIDDLELRWSTAEVCAIIGCDVLSKGDVSADLQIMGFTNNGISIMTGVDHLDIVH